MAGLKEVLEVTRANLAAADNGDPTPCYDSSIQMAEYLESVLRLVLEGRATPEEVDEELRKGSR